MTPFFYDRLADYFHTVHVLGALDDEQKQRAIAQMLGLAEPPTAPVVQPAEPDHGAAVSQPGGSTQTTGSGKSKAETTSSSGPVAPPPAPRRRKPVSYTIETASTRIQQRPAWLDDGEILEPPPTTAPPAARPQPLLRKQWSRAILSTAMATRTEINQIDVAAVLDAEVHGRILRRIPRRVVPSLSRGVQVLVDRGPSSEPFQADQELLVEQIRSVGGRETPVVELDSSRELEASAGDEYGDYFEKFRAPAGVVVVIVSDLGIVRVPFEEVALPADWLRFITRLRAGGNPVIAFVPFHPRRWPRDLARAVAARSFSIIPWDRTTTVQAVRRALRRMR